MARMPSINLTDHFLIAMPAMADPYFAKSLVYIAEHNDRGALGVIVNRPTEMSLVTLLAQIEMPLEAKIFPELPVFFGGPVQTDRGFVLHRPIGDWQSTLVVNAEVGLTSSRDILQSLARSGQPADIVVTLGYAGWSAGQLEHELGQNAWLTVPATLGILFELPYQDRLTSAMELLGVSRLHLVDEAGHA
ncbi:MAG TPA: YqgE/AlgH family protein [Accumulibacter sp.]|nr:YqgE/AlgH family protein [Accumulibacter sp.]HMW17321.1 YqgE/AlgH family protein [Accumulibacter sp.]HMX21721.1 YqgE/AlgH family protein [Accumulibacter sp.]HMY06189.1 YqgE/AlgH family protein [Accumulibacter sp.]HNC17506.1 YqgE/AlgH family protein [Accumulibacter sp.]